MSATIQEPSPKSDNECEGTVMHYNASQTVGEDEIVRLCTHHAEAAGYGIDDYVGSAADNAKCDEAQPHADGQPFGAFTARRLYDELMTIATRFGITVNLLDLLRPDAPDQMRYDLACLRILSRLEQRLDEPDTNTNE